MPCVWETGRIEGNSRVEDLKMSFGRGDSSVTAVLESSTVFKGA